MPLYEYKCTSCGKRFELIQKFSDPPQTACPSCGQTAERQLSAPAIQFKGSGWYITDYARKSEPSKGKDESKSDSAAKDSGTKDSGKSETKTGSKKSSPDSKASD
ncbi:MAG: zinc ribbon domain-containing protein [Acidobacteria bacterium]|nr:zinc ribbon domain-containing protein [Acidobacteriota bacterium]